MNRIAFASLDATDVGAVKVCLLCQVGTIHHRFTVAASDGGTSLTKSADLTQPSFLAKLTSWKISKGIPEGLRSDVEKIKARLESRSS